MEVAAQRPPLVDKAAREAVAPLAPLVAAKPEPDRAAPPTPVMPREKSFVKVPLRANSGAARAPAVVSVSVAVAPSTVDVTGLKRAAAVVSPAGKAAMASAGVSFGVTVFGISGMRSTVGSQGSRPSAYCKQRQRWRDKKRAAGD